MRDENLDDSAKLDFINQAERFKLWCKIALKYWHETAADPRGGYAELLNMDGSADYDHVRRVRVQARMAYTYAHAAHMGWYDDAQAACDHAWRFLIGPGFAGGAFIKTPPKGCAHLVNGDGSLHNDMRDLYAQAFVMLAGAWRYQAFGDRQALSIAKDTIRFIDRDLKAENGGWFEALPAPRSSMRRQNPHMHIFEAMLALYDATQDRTFLAYADDLYTLFETRFFDPETGGILEFFSPRWQPHEDDGGPLEPGHMMEWCWLLRYYERLSGRDVGTYADKLFASGLSYGLNERLGLLRNSVNRDYSPANSNLRSWPQTELIKASIAQAVSGQLDKLAIATTAIKAMFETYLSVEIEGGWADELDPDGKIISDTMPTSTFYHLFCAASEADALAGRLQL